jgi:hypothetical protein
MLPFDMCTMAFDGNEGGPFRCYSDDNFSTYKPFYANDCEYLVGVEENQMHKLAIFPNPSAGKFTIEAPLQSGQAIELYNLNGQQVFKQDILNSVVNQTLEIDLTPGMYVLKLISQDGVQLASSRLVVE